MAFRSQPKLLRRGSPGRLASVAVASAAGLISTAAAPVSDAAAATTNEGSGKVVALWHLDESPVDPLTMVDSSGEADSSRRCGEY